VTKTDLHGLAIFGGEPAFEEVLHVGRPNIGDRERLLERINDLLDRRWLTNRGPYVREFEERLQEYLGVKHAIAMCNATVGLEIAIRALEMTGEVIVPSFTFVATAHALQWQEITPVFADVDPDTHNLDPAAVEAMITPRTGGIIGVHLWGRPAAVEALGEVARWHDLCLLFDAAHAFGCSHEGAMIGNFGDAEVFSFHATKFFNTFEGGAVTTNDDALATKIRLMQNFGFAGLDNVVYVGTNGKMSEVSAAMGLTGMETIDEFIAVNRRNYLAYEHFLATVPGIELIEYDGTEQRNYQYVVAEVDGSPRGMDRDLLVQILHAEHIRARRYFFPGCHRMEPYRSYFPHAGLLLPITERLTERVISLPTGTAVTEEDVACICQVMRFAMARGEDIRRRAEAEESIPA
jgi:dTDP-4-amino-4,6-dideoxygalactose transaminase